VVVPTVFKVYSYFLCLDTKKVSKEKSRLKILNTAANNKKLATTGNSLRPIMIQGQEGNEAGKPFILIFVSKSGGLGK
jgi:hypothetical protein